MGILVWYFSFVAAFAIAFLVGDENGFTDLSWGFIGLSVVLLISMVIYSQRANRQAHLERAKEEHAARIHRLKCCRSMPVILCGPDRTVLMFCNSCQFEESLGHNANIHDVAKMQNVHNNKEIYDVPDSTDS